MDKLKDIYNNRECVILTCGPSLTEYSKFDVINFIKDKIVICIKESIIEYKNEADYFVSNGTRDRIYNFNSKTIKIFQSNNETKSKNNSDIILNEDHPFCHQ